jgi:hypothetical protein
MRSLWRSYLDRIDAFIKRKCYLETRPTRFRDFKRYSFLTKTPHANVQLIPALRGIVSEPSHRICRALCDFNNFIAVDAPNSHLCIGNNSVVFIDHNSADRLNSDRPFMLFICRRKIQFRQTNLRRGTETDEQQHRDAEFAASAHPFHSSIIFTKSLNR